MKEGTIRQHGTHAKYAIDGCRCFPCRRAHYEYNEHRRKQIAYGRWRPFVDAGPVRDHVRWLMSQGLGWRRACRLAGVPEAAVNRLLYGEGTEAPLPARVRAETAEKLLAVQPTLEVLGDTVPIEGTGTHRRLQALVALGWSQSKLAARLGMNGTNLGRMMASPKVRAAKARDVRALYDQLWDTAPPESGWRDKIAANRARGYAAERGWVPPMAWDDDTIDDPAAVPHGVEPVTDTRAKLPAGEELLWLLDGGESPEALAVRFGVKPSAVRQAIGRARKREAAAA